MKRANILMEKEKEKENDVRDTILKAHGLHILRKMGS